MPRTRRAKKWGTKQSLVRDVAAADHGRTVKTKLTDLVETVVQRPTAARTASTCASLEPWTVRICAAGRKPPLGPTPHGHAGYVLWLLDRPEVPNTIHVRQSWIAAGARE
ncbi:hypothetical protein ABT025_19705 [Streptomyces sp. NPDC002809]|uniref:hypothetical protein n=1 Tax=Streptomyces sp. NPDC002809 TaxID=3154433 RepID=UPI0033217226